MPYSMIIRLNSDRNYKKFNGQQVHGLLYNLLSSEEDEIADKIHDKYEIKPVTTSIIKSVPCLRFTFLQKEIADVFLRACLNGQNFPLKLGKQKIHPDKIITSGNNKMSGHCKYKDMLGNYAKSFRMKFITPTTFRKGKLNHPLPDLKSMFKGLTRKWNLFSGWKYNQDKILNYVDKVIAVKRHDIQSDVVKYQDHMQVGFMGNLEVEIFDDDKEMREKIQSLVEFSFYAGVGYKTTMGMGQVMIS